MITKNKSQINAVRGFSRRDLLKGAGLFVVGFSVSGVASAAGLAHPAAGAGVDMAFADIPIDQLDSYLAIAQDGDVTIFTGRIDMGTGNRTCFKQFVADELDVSIDRIEVIAGDTDLTPDGGKTTASDAIPVGAQPLRVSAATARAKLLELASGRLGVPVDQLTVSDGVVSVKSDPSKTISYWDLIGGGRFGIKLEVDRLTLSGPILKIPAGVTLKTVDQYKYVGKSVPRYDVPERLILGNFCQNVRLPGMLHGRLLRPATYGATLVSVDESSVKDIPGFVKLVVEGSFVGVVCEREEQAIQAQERLKVIWSEGTGLPGSENVFRFIRTQPADKRPTRSDATAIKGDVATALGSAAKTLRATYEYPWNATTMFAPSCAVADVQADKATVWSGTQWPRYTQKDVAFLLGLPTESVRVIWVEESGSYGRLGAADAAADAALLSKAVGKPVRVQWTRQEEHAWAPHQPPLVMDLRGGLDAQGNLVAWEYESWSSTTHDTGRGGGLLAMRLVGRDPGPRNTPSGASASTSPSRYIIPNVRGAAHVVVPLLRSIYMRSPGGIQRAFIDESFMDELAAAAGVDPIDFRLRYLSPGIEVELIDVVRKSSGWVTRPSPNQNASSNARFVTGRGFGRGYEVQMVVEVEVDRETGKVRIIQAWLAYSPGLIVNPDGLTNQLEQAALQGMSRVLTEEVTFDNSKVTSVDWITHPVLKFSETPKLHVNIVNRPDLPLDGAGENGTPPTAPAIGNAIFDATGVRLRRAPFTPERVLAALKAHDSGGHDH
ncbi:MAG: xanthine dehydrogenase family protein molybdopterin-binding subunit [Acidobacteria bacterium]|nr:xanthine dehydrogenase family protein molybdopterin-binding subunit [Acidobacteriota bacterium]